MKDQMQNQAKSTLEKIVYTRQDTMFLKLPKKTENKT